MSIFTELIDGLEKGDRSMEHIVPAPLREQRSTATYVDDPMEFKRMENMREMMRNWERDRSGEPSYKWVSNTARGFFGL